MTSFWHQLPRPIVGLSAMDGVTDASMREVTAKIGQPDFMVTEFTSADGLVRGVTRILRDFYFTENQRPIVAQIFGADPEAFRKVAILCGFLGFDGIDLNMGCPADSVARKGGGAALIKTPKLAQELMKAAKQGAADFVNGIELSELGLPLEFIQEISARYVSPAQRQPLPISIKTRIGYDKPVISEWIPALLETEPAVITLHGRTLLQQYGGKADWEQIAKAAELVHQTETLIFGNGDLKTPSQIAQKIKDSHVDGAWIGRAAMGNPWIFSQWKAFKAGKEITEPTVDERFATALIHARQFEKFNETVFSRDPLPFLNMRKHLGWYTKGFPDASDLRQTLFQTNSSGEVEAVFRQFSALHSLQ